MDQLDDEHVYKTTVDETIPDNRIFRRAALKKFGFTASATLFTFFAVDDPARVSLKALEEISITRETASSLHAVFKNSGMAFADLNGMGDPVPCQENTGNCGCVPDCVPDDNYDCDQCVCPGPDGTTPESLLGWSFRKPKKPKLPPGVASPCDGYNYYNYLLNNYSADAVNHCDDWCGNTYNTPNYGTNDCPSGGLDAGGFNTCQAGCANAKAGFPNVEPNRGKQH